MATLIQFVEPAGILTKETAVMMHTASTPGLRNGLINMARSAPDVFLAYQSIHSKQRSATLRRHRYFLSFVPSPDGRMTFAGLWNNEGSHERPLEAYSRDRRFRRLVEEWGDRWCNDAPESNGLKTREYFDVTPHVALVEYIGRMQIDWPTGPLIYIRELARYDVPFTVKEQPW